MTAQILPFQSGHAHGPTIGDVLDWYMAYAGKLIYTAASAQNRQWVYERLRRDLGCRPVAGCRRSDLEIWLASRDTWSDATRKAANQYIQRAFNWCADPAEGRIERNPFKGAKWFSDDRRRPATAEEFRRLLEAAAEPFRRVLWFLSWTGCRPGELRQLRWEHYEPQARRFLLRKHKTRKMQKEPKPRKIFLIPDAVELVERIWAEQKEVGLDLEPGFVFINSRGTAWTKTSLDNRLYRLRAKLGLPKECVLYGLRHAFCTNAVKNGLHLKTLAELAGHSTTAMLERHYVHVDEEEEFLAAEMLRAQKKDAPK